MEEGMKCWGAVVYLGNCRESGWLISLPSEAAQEWDECLPVPLSEMNSYGGCKQSAPKKAKLFCKQKCREYRLTAALGYRRHTMRRVDNCGRRAYLPLLCRVPSRSQAAECDERVSAFETYCRRVSQPFCRQSRYVCVSSCIAT